MNNSTINPAPPILDGLIWRPVTRDDLPKLVNLAYDFRASHREGYDPSSQKSLIGFGCAQSSPWSRFSVEKGDS